MFRTLVILRHTLREAMVQPIYSVLLLVGAAVLVVYALLPFFTLSEDAVMFKAVGLDVILLLVLIATLFATSKSVFDEIEDRTMLTLMSKPLRRGEVLLGKFLGISAAALVAVAVLGFVLGLCLWLRIPGDYMLDPNSLDDRTLREIANWRRHHLAGLLPQLVLLWLQLSVLTAVGVALSTRLPLVVNLPLVILLYMAGNLTRFLFGLENSTSMLGWALIHLLATVLPYLAVFDLRDVTVYGRLLTGQFAKDINAVPLGQVWLYVLTATGYAAAYSLLALLAGLWLFRRRELGGAEG